MRIVGFFFLLLLTGGNASSLELQDYDGNASSSELQEIGMPLDNFPTIEKPEDILIFERMRNRQMDIDESCSSQAVVNYLNLTQDSHKYTLSRPVKRHNHLTWIFVEMKIFAILDVRETDQTFISYIWVYLRWDNEHIWWDPDEFCGLDHILVPTKLLWMPDLTIEEMTEKDKASPSPYLNIRNYGWVEFRNDQVVLSTCKMHVYKFPFDIQSCNLSVKSIMHSDKEILLFYQENSTLISEWSREVMHTQYEWLFISMSVTNKTVNHFGFNQTTIIYTITMKRRSVLYIANFLLPVLFFLFLDLASFLIADSGGEKLGFKITVLLAVTVMQLILNEILPCSSNKVPLIAIYCIGIFALMLLSLLETILVMYLIEKDSTAQHNETNGDQSLTEKCGDKQGKSNFQCSFIDMTKFIHCASVYDAATDEAPPVTKEGSTNKLMDVSFDMEKISDELEKIEKTVNLLNSNGSKEEKSGYWTRMLVTWIFIEAGSAARSSFSNLIELSF
ncbi:5-hydroxytryptamine receptor 3A-like [Oreochromis aureus]|uniref:5-hydroxytryptamine receptor 3A-like n=1 Tax=Oreochromis aureus TaxID=47969 RepID=UPI0019541FC0|nr:5-hydroxytryptamine receptor 3A-like [Oreochromis aureus]